MNRSGQVVFEFVIAAIFFLGLVFYVLNYIDINANAYGNDAITTDLEGKAFRVGELLVTSHAGIVSAYPVLDPEAFRRLDPGHPASDCPAGDTAPLLQRFDLLNRRIGNYHLRIDAWSGPLLLFSCGQQAPPGVKSASVQRAGLLDGRVVRLQVTVW